MIEPVWFGQPVVIIAGGPSLTKEDVDHCRGRARVIVVNDGYRIAPWADLLYAADTAWWGVHAGAPNFAGQRWTRSVPAARIWGLNWIRAQEAYGLSLNPDVIHSGGNSGYQALNIATLMGARQVFLLGFDMQRTFGRRHWFGDHPPALKQDSDYGTWFRWFEGAARQCHLRGVRVLNCSRETALTSFPRSVITDCL